MPPDDFFDEDWEEPSRTQDTAVTRPDGAADAPQVAGAPRAERPRQPRAGPRGPGRGGRRPRPPGGGPQIEYARLAVLAVGILVVVLLLWFLVNLLTGGGSNPTDRYLARVSAVAAQSQHTGEQFHKLLVTPGETQQSFTTGLGAVVRQAQGELTTAEGITPTSQLQSANSFLVLAMRYRLNGLQCMRADVTAAFARKSALGGGEQMAKCTRKLMASDVIYTDSFAITASDALQSGHVSHSGSVPTSRFLQQADAPLVLAANFGQVINRIRRGAHGLHGTSLVPADIVANPGKVVLTSGGTGRVQVTSGLTFSVTVHNSGNFEEVGIRVDLTLRQQKVAGATSIRKTLTIASLQPGQSQRVTFGGLFSSSSQPQFSQPYSLLIRVEPVPGEKVLSNNRILTTVNFLLH